MRSAVDYTQASKNFLYFLRQRLQRKLPAFEAHRQMMPVSRRVAPLPGAPTRRGAVLVPLLVPPLVQQLTVLLVRRSFQVSNHRGQLGFPGGRIHSNETVEQAAIREFHEEVDPTFDVSAIEILGRLSQLYIPVSLYWVYPVVAVLHYVPSFTPNVEVEQVVMVPLEELQQPQRQRIVKQQQGNQQVIYPAWDVGLPVLLWGATAMILSELLWLYREFDRDDVAGNPRSGEC